MAQNALKAVFWDHPDLCDVEAVRRLVADSRLRHDEQTLLWVLGRFLERARVCDAAEVFRIEEIRDRLPHLKVTPRARARWQRLVEVYGPSR